MSDNKSRPLRAGNKSQQPVVCLVSLGCAKNTVDSERLLGLLVSAGFLIAADPADADLCLVNTCGFIQEARAESAATLRELAGLKVRGRLRAVAALGCLAERARDVPELAGLLAAADALIRFDDYPRLAEICRALLAQQTPDTTAAAGAAGLSHVPDEFYRLPRLRMGAPHTAYLKISEGCSNPCRFCAIPRIRGRQVSRPIKALVQEARELIALGARELNLIAQDTTSYGRDLYGAFRLPALLRALRALPDPVWFRLLYAYPRHLSDAVLDVLASDERFCPYLDLPLQHISDAMLAAMGRGMTRAQTVALLDRLPRKLPGVTLRTSFIVGYPGETERDFAELLDFVREGCFTHAGVFIYSHEPRTPAARLKDDVPPAEKIRRRDTLLQAQRAVSRQHQRARVGRTLRVLVDGPVERGAKVPAGARAIARSRHEAPEVDGVIYLRGAGAQRLAPGTFLDARIVRGLDYDAVAEIAPAPPALLTDTRSKKHQTG
ncbi:MAG: 30S ribosomal protein S12 methylthiotransferase RimO [Kiritimatiellaeota bacterium]|nr:30S ribosomal protein S12 methylthiotransferase RimO [Kiritimatiellota bacterium]